MNSAILTDHRNAAPTARRPRSPFGMLLSKDLRLGAVVFVPCLSLLSILALFSAALPLFGEEFTRSWALQRMVSQEDLPGRIAYFAKGYWLIAIVGGVLSALAIVAGDNGCRARYLLPALPVSSRLAYTSKLAASAIVVGFFLAVALCVEAMSEGGSLSDALALAAFLSIGLIWVFAAPLFARGFAAVFLVTVCVPLALFGLCALTGRFVATIALEETLVAIGAARWYDDWGSMQSIRGSLARDPIERATMICASVTVAAVGLWGAWNARGVMLCRRSPRGPAPARLLRFAGVALLAVLVATIATAVRTWQSDEKIATALATARVYEDLSSVSTAELVETFVQSRARIDPPAHLPNGQITPVWDAVLRASDPFQRWSSAGWRFGRALAAVLRDRRESDPAQFKGAMRSVLAGTEGRTIGMQLAAAQSFGGYTHTMVAVQGLARTTDDNERAALLLALRLNAHLFGPEQPRPTAEALTSPDRPRPWGFVGWDLPPYRIRDFDIEQQYRFVEARVSVVLLLTSLERQRQDGALKLQNAYKRDDWLEIDAATLRAAREAAERPLADLARGSGVIAQRSSDPSRYSDDQTLYLRTSDLFDPAKTDPSYLLPEK